ncbi:hypothetical protein BB542_23870 [Escherichia coli]|uniref:hypothetical protein n=1 Tax=Escherichia coli TaxID=562 RepID=UPI000BB70587|nr:hypothetical protein [Escherichia coli]EAN2687292.1 hypothetical protein [Salmonella enterica]EIX9709506.1 hypothetical protein [Klebsiella pneumoniae]EGP2767377.1 hypothetical protein [Salmonella enterica]PBU46686.1 hypothetical protein BB541_24015 [Escherichia coli]PBU51375.1 hypothetical protein BB542_23870 [Escherichia coli]
MELAFKCIRRRLDQDNTVKTLIKLTQNQLDFIDNHISKNSRSLAVSQLSKWAIEKLVNENKVLNISFLEDGYHFTEDDTESSSLHVVSLDKSYKSESKYVSVVASKEVIDLLKEKTERIALSRVLPALTIYALNELLAKKEMYVYDSVNNINQIIKQRS